MIGSNLNRVIGWPLVGDWDLAEQIAGKINPSTFKGSMLVLASRVEGI